MPQCMIIFSRGMTETLPIPAAGIEHPGHARHWRWVPARGPKLH